MDVDFIDNFGIEVVAGRGFSNDFATDAAAAFVIKETAVKHFGWRSPEDAIGKRFVRGNRGGEIVGVVKDFNYRIDISWRIFLVAVLAALLVAWLTVSYQSIRAALANPVESLRYE